MSNEMIQIMGLTPVSEYPQCPPQHPCIEVCETDKLYIPYPKPDMEDIVEVFVSVSIASFKVICSPQGEKLVIDGLKHVKLLYVADESCQNVHCAHFQIPFCTFILLRDKHTNIACIETAVEHISVSKMTSRAFIVSVILFLCPKFRKHHNDYQCIEKECYLECDCNEEECDCDCNYDSDEEDYNDSSHGNIDCHCMDKGEHHKNYYCEEEFDWDKYHHKKRNYDKDCCRNKKRYNDNVPCKEECDNCKCSRAHKTKSKHRR